MPLLDPGVITEYPIPEPGSGQYDITTGPDGALWFTETQASQIGRITTKARSTVQKCMLA